MDDTCLICVAVFASFLNKFGTFKVALSVFDDLNGSDYQKWNRDHHKWMTSCQKWFRNHEK